MASGHRLEGLLGTRQPAPPHIPDGSPQPQVQVARGEHSEGCASTAFPQRHRAWALRRCQPVAIAIIPLSRSALVRRARSAAVPRAILQVSSWERQRNHVYRWFPEKGGKTEHAHVQITRRKRHDKPAAAAMIREERDPNSTSAASTPFLPHFVHPAGPPCLFHEEM
jgi:hypothetical protein